MGQRTILSAACWFLWLASISVADETVKPNIILIFCDDLGYGDLGCYGSEKNRTPNIDRLADQGIRFTSFYSSSPVCTPSRSSLMTGCYPRRVGMHEAETGHWVLIPRNRRGLHPEETTLAEVLKSNGYATACVGKWHLGDQPPHLPTNHGFDYYFGIPYSNDMQSAGRGDPPLPLVRDREVIEAPADQATLTQRYTREVISFVERHRDEPFFVYLPHTFPHLPLFASPAFHGKSGNGRYGDSVEEIDWSTGKIMETLTRLGIENRTILIFTSDNGSNGRNGGSNAPLAGAKGSTMEGGMRVPMIARWPNRFPAGQTVDQLASTMDFLPTLAALTNSELPSRKLDGHDISRLLSGEPEAKSPYEVFYYYRRRQLQAVRWGDWKLHLPLNATFPNWTTPTKTSRGRPAKLINLTTDLQEENDVSEEHPQVLARLHEYARQAISTLGNESASGSEQRPAFDIANPMPLRKKASAGPNTKGLESKP